MNNDKQVIKGVTGEWRQVRSANEVELGQRVRYRRNRHRFGYADHPKKMYQVRNVQCPLKLFDGHWDVVEAWFPVNKRVKVAGKPSKDAKCSLMRIDAGYWYDLDAGNVTVTMKGLASKPCVIRRAKVMALKLGYNCVFINKDNV